MRLRNTLLIGILSLSALGLKAQDPHFSQFYANPLYLNPAFAGSAGGPRFALNYRNQWPGAGGAFNTVSASYDEHFDGLQGGIGAQVMYDRGGDGNLSTTYLSGMYSYHLAIRDERDDYFIVKAGIQAGAFQRSIDFSKLNFGDQIHPRLGFIYPTQETFPNGGKGVYQTSFIPDFNAGVMAFTPTFYGGLAVRHLIAPSQSFYKNPISTLPRTFIAHAGLTLPLDKMKREPETFISPNILIQKQSKFFEANIGAYLTKRYFVAGLWYRQSDPNADALTMLVGFRKDAIKVGYSYDLTVSGARAAAAGSHEVSLIVELQKYNRNNKRKWRRLVCPQF